MEWIIHAVNCYETYLQTVIYYFKKKVSGKIMPGNRSMSFVGAKADGLWLLGDNSYITWP